MNKNPELVKSGFLTEGDPNPVEWVNEDSQSPILLVCEHAGQAIPKLLGDLGLDDEARNSHIGWDIGAEKLARAMAARLDAPLIIQRYSRLVVDCNRPPQSPSHIPEQSDDVIVPANQALNFEKSSARTEAIFAPYDMALKSALTGKSKRAAFSVHSFTPQMRQGAPRPWHAGFLSRKDEETACALRDHVNSNNPELNAAINEPYQIGYESDWFIPQYAEANNLRHALIEIRNDQLQHDNGVTFWAETLTQTIQEILEATTWH